MQPIHRAVRDVAEASLAMLEDAVRGLPDPALDLDARLRDEFDRGARHPQPDQPRLLGRRRNRVSPDHDCYRDQVRAAAFRTRGATVENLLTEIKESAAELALTLERADSHVLDQPVAGTEDNEGNLRTGAACLVHGIGHLREHVGQAMLMRDLWSAASREGR